MFTYVLFCLTIKYTVKAIAISLKAIALLIKIMFFPLFWSSGKKRSCKKMREGEFDGF